MLKFSRELSRFRIIVLLVLFTSGAWAEMRNLTSLSGDDVWWRIRTGEWILHHHSLPSHALFTRSTELSWTVSGWSFDLLIAIAYSVCGLVTVPLVAMLARCALSVVLFLLAGGLEERAWLPASVTAAFALWLAGPQPCSPRAIGVLLYGAVLILVLYARQHAAPRALYALPVLFLVWATLGPEFLWGVLLLVFFVATEIAQAQFPALRTSGRGQLPIAAVLGCTAASICAPLLTPYSYHLFLNFFAELYSHSAFKYFPEMNALGFRQPRDFALALFVLGAFFVLGRRRDWFLLLAVLVTLPVVFRIQRDSWVALLPATAAFALLWQVPEEKETGRLRDSRALIASALAAVAGIVIVAFMSLPSAKLQQQVKKHFPVQATEYVANHRLPGPMFELSSWGGYLIFALPDYPVVMDHRLAMYGDAAYDLEQQLASGQVPIESVQTFAESRTLLLPADSAIAQALTTMPQFRARYNVLYKDSQAVVLEAQ